MYAAALDKLIGLKLKPVDETAKAKELEILAAYVSAQGVVVVVKNPVSGGVTERKLAGHTLVLD